MFLWYATFFHYLFLADSLESHLRNCLSNVVPLLIGVNTKLPVILIPSCLIDNTLVFNGQVKWRNEYVKFHQFPTF